MARRWLAVCVPGSVLLQDSRTSDFVEAPSKDVSTYFLCGEKDVLGVGARFPFFLAAPPPNGQHFLQSKGLDIFVYALFMFRISVNL